MSQIDVAAAVITKDDLYLIAQRKTGSHLENMWEFPGGKLEEGETPQDCLHRELQEEFGIAVVVHDFVTESVFKYGDRRIRLLAYLTEHLDGEFILHDHNAIAWIPIHEFDKYEIAPADIPIVEKLRDSNDKTV